MHRQASETVSFPTERAFVIQFRPNTDRAGRIEHVASGQSARFHSPEDVLVFIGRVLTELEAAAPRSR